MSLLSERKALGCKGFMVLFVPKNRENPEVKVQNRIGISIAVSHYGSVFGSNVGQGLRVLRQRKRLKNCGAETKNSRGKISPAETTNRRGKLSPAETITRDDLGALIECTEERHRLPL